MSTAFFPQEHGAGASAPAKSSPRQRILAAAQDLFSRHGFHGVGVDAIAEAAGSTKMTLYRHFPSKEALTAECLKAAADTFDSDWDTIAKAHRGDPRGQLLAWLCYLGDFLVNEDGRGCAIANAAIELAERDHPARQLIHRLKTEQSEKLAGLCREAEYIDPERLADELILVFEGARVSVQSVGITGPASRLNGLVRAIIASHVPA